MTCWSRRLTNEINYCRKLEEETPFKKKKKKKSIFKTSTTLFFCARNNIILEIVFKKQLYLRVQQHFVTTI